MKIIVKPSQFTTHYAFPFPLSRTIQTQVKLA